MSAESVPFAWQDLDARLRVAVFGSGGGIGSALVDALLARPGVAEIHALSRPGREANPGHADEQGRLRRIGVDIDCDESLAAAARDVGGPLDLVIVASGTLHGKSFRPERRISDLDAATMLEVFRINTVAPALVGKHYLPLLRKDRAAVFAALSARVGSIGDNRLGGWTSYRASKAALNMVLRNFAIEQARTRPQTIVVGLHPGTVDTELSKPFAGRVPPEQLFTPERSAAHLLSVIDGLGPDDSGAVFAWDGQRVPC
ncbi:MAG: SDR family NAD(P)-dependent oxidoreductase [Pseudomonadota bacterium]